MSDAKEDLDETDLKQAFILADSLEALARANPTNPLSGHLAVPAMFLRSLATWVRDLRDHG